MTRGEAPSAEEAGVLFELSGGEIGPLDHEVALELYVTSAYEWSGYSIALEFPAPKLRFLGADEHQARGAVRFDDPNGWLGIVYGGLHRRLGAEGERMHLATLHFAVSETTGPGVDLSPRFAPTPFPINWLEIRRAGGIAGELPISTEVAPLETSVELLATTRPSAATGPSGVSDSRSPDRPEFRTPPRPSDRPEFRTPARRIVRSFGRFQP